MDIMVEKNIMVRMRDGVGLATDVYRPADPAPVPVLVQRLPYNKERLSQGDILRMAQCGYVIVIQDTRGCHASEGVFSPFFQEPDDGMDTIAWAASMPWSNGKVGTIGGSYVGATQLLAASRAPAALLAMAPYVTSTTNYFDVWSYQGGAFQLGFLLQWALGFALVERQRRERAGDGAADPMAIVAAIDRLPELYTHLPLQDMPILHTDARYYFDWLRHPSYDDYWQSIVPAAEPAPPMVPALHIGGWYDIFIQGTLANYMADRDGDAAAGRPRSRLLVGPWTHGYTGAMFPDRCYGMAAGGDMADLTGAQLRWFDYRLKGIDNGVAEERPVRIFVMGIDRWRDEDDWPLPDTKYRPYYLRGEDRANGLSGAGSLSMAPPEEEREDVFMYDPLHPVPTVGGASLLPGAFIAMNAGPRDQRAVESRDDVLCYSTPVLERPLEVTGSIALVLYVSSTARDTDFTGKLVDVWPDGRAELLTDGILRLRYRQSFAEPTLLEPDNVYRVQLNLGATAMVFAAGHRLRLEISSSNFPRFDRNSNTGGVIAAERASDMLQAVNRVYHDRARSSHLVLPIIERE
jgi:putative CocE/NonD family hydrolase